MLAALANERGGVRRLPPRMAPSAASISIEKQRCLARSYLFGSFHDTQSSVSGDRCISREHARIRNEQTRQQRYRPSPFYGIAENNEPHSGWCVGRARRLLAALILPRCISPLLAAELLPLGDGVDGGGDGVDVLGVDAW